MLAVIDYCWFTTHRALESLRQPVLQRLGIEEQNFLLLLTHSHAVPHIDADLEDKPGGDKIPAYRAKLIHALNSAIDAGPCDGAAGGIELGERLIDAGAHAGFPRRTERPDPVRPQSGRAWRTPL